MIGSEANGEPGERSSMSVRGPRSGGRPDHFSTYAPRDLVRRLKVIAAIHDVPLWAVVTDAMERYLERYERDHGRLPEAAGSPRRETSGR